MLVRIRNKRAVIDKMNTDEDANKKPMRNIRLRTIGETSMTGSYTLINKYTIHNVFGSKEGRISYSVYTIKKREMIANDNVEIGFSGSFHYDMESMMDAVRNLDPLIDKVWLYLPDEKFIIYLENSKGFIMDYGRFSDNTTPIVEFEWLSAVNGLLGDMRSTIKIASKLFDGVDADVKKMIAIDPMHCSYCGKKSNEELKINCIRCKVMYYCDRSCQGKHLPNHQKICIAFNKTKPAENRQLDRERNN